MTMGPAPMRRMRWRSVRRGMVGRGISRWRSGRVEGAPGRGRGRGRRRGRGRGGGAGGGGGRGGGRTLGPMVLIKRAYAAPASSDGTRVLVDRLWPRGISKADAHVDEWIKDVAPSDEARKAFGHDPDLWTAFKKQYLAELRQRGSAAREALDRLVALARKKRVTLLNAAKDETHNNAV